MAIAAPLPSRASTYHSVGAAAYVGKVREVRELTGTGVVVLRAVVGMVPPGADDINPDVNAVQTMVAASGRDGELRIALLQSTPAAFHGRPDEVDALTAELREELRRSRSR